MSIKNQNKNKKIVPVQLSPEDASVARMKIVEKNVMNGISLASKEVKKENLGEPTVFELIKILSRVQHHYAQIGITFQWETANEHNEKVLDEHKTIPIGGDA